MSENRAMEYAQILSKLIKVETVSSRDNKDITKFLGFHAKLSGGSFASFDMFIIVFSLSSKFIDIGNIYSKVCNRRT